MPSWQGGSTLLSVSLHGAVAVVCLLFAALPPRAIIPESPPMLELARIEMPVSEPPLLIERAVPPEELSGYDISGLPFNLAKIAARRASLFPFLTADLQFLERFAGDVRGAAAKLRNPLDPPLTAKPLALDGALLQQVVDESWSRRDRWQRFQQIRALLVGHDAHAGDAPALMRSYLDQNLLQPYCHGKTKDGQFWALLENASDHVDFIEFIRSYTRTRSSSRTTTELLFLLDELAQANLEVAQTVASINVAHDLAYSATVSPNAARLAAGISNDLRGWLGQHGYTQHEGVGPAYDQLRIRVLAAIVETSPGGYREADARYLAGEIFFRQGNVDLAREWWEPMRPHDGDTYAAAAARIRRVLDGGSFDTPAIRRILWAEKGRWHEQNYARLRHFGYRCDSF